MLDFEFYLESLNRCLLSTGREEADEESARRYFEEQLPIEQAANLETIEQDLEAMA